MIPLLWDRYELDYQMLFQTDFLSNRNRPTVFSLRLSYPVCEEVIG